MKRVHVAVALAVALCPFAVSAQFVQQGSKLVGSGATGNSSQGWSVAISGDGNTVIVGGPADDSGIGAAWVFARSGVSWAQVGSKLVGSHASGHANQGTSVALSADGATAVVGGPAGDGARVRKGDGELGHGGGRLRLRHRQPHRRPHHHRHGAVTESPRAEGGVGGVPLATLREHRKGVISRITRPPSDPRRSGRLALQPASRILPSAA